VAGFSNLVLDSQADFRRIMTAMSEPGTIVTLPCLPGAALPLGPAATALALTLCDYEAPVWLDPFLSGAPADAAFAFVGRSADLPSLSAFALGSLDYPERSTTVVIEVDRLSNGAGWRLTGPGIVADVRLEAGPLPATFTEELTANRALFPCGVDVVLCCGTRLAALPRSTRLEI
jgi:alpha-D-ribose 1-methylphosphonate 5-triphosphate synthase subunit PhnH